MTGPRNPKTTKPFESTTLAVNRALFCNFYQIDAKQVDTQSRVLKQLVSLSIQSSQTGEKLLPTSINNKLLDHSSAVIAKIPKSADANAAKQLLEQQHVLTKKLEEQEKKAEDLRTRLANYLQELRKNVQDLIKVGALQSATVAYSQPVTNQINNEIKELKNIDHDAKRYAEQQANLTEDTVGFTHSVLRRQPDAQPISTIISPDEQHLLRR